MVMTFFFKRVWKLFAIFMVVFIISSILFFYTEYEEPKDRDDGYSGPDDFADSFWYGIVTLSTVGYGDRFPVTTEGKVAAFFLIVFTFTFLGALIGQISDAFNEARRREELGMDGTTFKNHAVLVGWISMSNVTLVELLAAEQKTVVVSDNADDIPKIRDLGRKKYLYTVFGDYKSEKVLDRANIKGAKTIIIATNDDTESLIVSLMAKQLNPNARMIVSINQDELKNTLYSAGVTYVSSPSEMTGRMVASAAFEPEVALFVEDVTSATAGYDLQQYTISHDSFANGMSVKKFREKSYSMKGPLLVALGKYEPKKGARKESPRNWDLISNPEAALKIAEKDIVVVLGDDDENERLAKILKSKQGR